MMALGILPGLCSVTFRQLSIEAIALMAEPKRLRFSARFNGNVSRLLTIIGCQRPCHRIA